MTIANVSPSSTLGSLPPALRAAQEAIRLPEVQEMLRKLSEYKLGIFMPHMHEARTGEFQQLSDGIMQVESGLEVFFQPMEKLANETGRFLPVAWCWRAGASVPLAVCEMVTEAQPDDSEPRVKHKMPKGSQRNASTHG